MTHDYKKITKQFGISYFFMFLTFLLSPLLTFILTRALSIEEYGVYSILSATIAIATSFLMLGLPHYIMTKLPGFNFSDKLKHFFSVLFFQTIFLIIIFSIIAFPSITNFLVYHLKIGSYMVEFYISLIIIILTILASFFSYYLNATYRIGMQAFIGFTTSYLWIIFLIFFFLIYETLNLKSVFFIWLAGITISLIILFFYFNRKIYFLLTNIKDFSLKSIKSALSFSLPLIPFTVGTWAMMMASRYILVYYDGLSSVGVYSLAYSLASIVYGFTAVISGVLYPYIAKSLSEKKDHQILFNAMLKYTLMIILPGMVGIFVLREPIISLIAGLNYLPGSSVLAILAIFPIFAALISIYTNDLMLREKTWLIAILYTSFAILNIILNVILIPIYNIEGAAVATVISYILMFLVMHLLLRKQFIWNNNFLRVGRISLSALAMGIILFLINPQIFLTKILSILLGVIIYALALIIFGVFIKEEYGILFSILPSFIAKIIKIKH